MARNHEVGDIVMTNEKPQRVAVVVNKYHVISETQYDIYLPENGRLSYSWDGWDLYWIIT